ncbi:hypothetical protein H101_08122 [Trichophyton interdigitale H6]|nr:hypothetical protein H101_08122 [Trichophyton interdigitale H6]
MDTLLIGLLPPSERINYLESSRSRGRSKEQKSTRHKRQETRDKRACPVPPCLLSGLSAASPAASASASLPFPARAVRSSLDQCMRFGGLWIPEAFHGISAFGRS